MRWTLPIYAVVEATGPTDAQAKLDKLKALLKQPMVSVIAQSEGITLHQVYSAAPSPTPDMKAVKPT